VEARPPGNVRLGFVAASCSHPGLVRDNNEDSVFAGQSLIAVADGVGGSVYGEVASARAIDAIAYLENTRPDGPLRHFGYAALERVTATLASEVAADASRRGMATTLTALLAAGESVVVLHVGDSRAYRWRGPEWRQLTRDDSLVQGLVDAGALSADEAQRHPARSVVLQAFNGGPVEPHLTVLDVEAGDRYLICSDGLSDYVDGVDIARIAAAPSAPDDCCAHLIDAALAAGAPDNVTCVVADVAAVPARGHDL
jgi:PPM family protein phosphatase